MSKKQRYIARSRGVSSLYAHLVLTCKYRKSRITALMLLRLKEITQDLCEKWQCECIEVNGEPNHLHLLFRYAPQLQLSKFIGNLKSVTSRRVKQEFNLKIDSFWNESYSIDSVGGAPLETLKKYVQNQDGC